MSLRKTSVEINEDLLTAVKQILATTTVKEIIERAFLEVLRTKARREEVEALSTMSGMDQRLTPLPPFERRGIEGGFLLLLILALAFPGCSREVPEDQEILRPVRSQTVIATGGSRARTFSGTARAGQETNLSFRVPGKVVRLGVEVGDTVGAGDLIARLEEADFTIAVRRAEANLVQAQAAARNAAADLERVRSLYENDDVSRNELDAAMARDQSAGAQEEGAAQSLAGARRQLGYTRLVAPVDGAVASVPVEVNENVRQGQTVARMTSGSRPEVEVAIPGVLIAQIEEGGAVTVTFDALPEETFDAVVTEVGVASTSTGTTFPVTVRLLSDSRGVRSGMAANAEFRFAAADSREHICVPPHAVGEDREGRFVFLLEAGDEEGAGVVRRTAVEVAPDLRPEGLEILSGLEEGQRLVTAGVRRLTDGQRVRLLVGGPRGGNTAEGELP